MLVVGVGVPIARVAHLVVSVVVALEPRTIKLRPAVLTAQAEVEVVLETRPG
jgi:hypothetical protein